MNMHKNTNKQGEKILLSGVAAAALGLINAKPRAVKAATLNGNRATKKTTRRTVKTKLNYQTETGSETAGETATADPTDQDSGSQTKVNTADSTTSDQDQNSTTNTNDNAASEITPGPSTASNKQSDSTNKKISKKDSNNVISSKWNNLDVTFNNQTDELVISGGTDENPAVIDKTATPNAPIGINGHIDLVSADSIKTITLKGKIKFIGDATNLFSGLQNLTTINGLNNLDVSQATSLSNMFSNDYSLQNLDLTSFDTANVTDMSSMFEGCYALKDLKYDPDKFKTDKVTNMSYMFQRCYRLSKLDLSKFNTTNVTDMSHMFDDLGSTTLDLSSFDTSNVTNMAGMFEGNGLATLDITKFKTSKVTDMSDMFDACKNLKNINLSNLDTSNVTDMTRMFQDCRGLTSLDLSNFNTANVTNMHQMFESCTSLSTLDVSPLNTANVTNMAEMFEDCVDLTDLDISMLNTSNVTNMSEMFQSCASLTKVNVSKIDTSKVERMDHMFYNCGVLPSLDLSTFNTSSVTNFNGMFRDCAHLKSLDISHFKTTAKTVIPGGISMQFMFEGCLSLPAIDVSSFDTSNVGDMSSMFQNTFSLKTLDLSNFNTSNVTNMTDMFYQSGITSVDLSSFDTSKVSNMETMFQSSNIVRLNLSNFDMTNVISKGYMLGGMRNLKVLILGKNVDLKEGYVQPGSTWGDSPSINDLPNNGKWINVGVNGQLLQGAHKWTSQELMENYNGKSDYDVYVNFPNPSLITIKYVDETDPTKIISPTDYQCGKSGESLTDPIKPRKIDNYDFSSVHATLNGKDVSDLNSLNNLKFSSASDPQTVTFFYKPKNPETPPEQNKAEQVTVYYMYRSDNGELVEIPGSDPEKFPKDATQSVVGKTVRIPFKSIDGYTPDSYQVNKGDIIQNTNVPDVTLTVKPQSVTLIYTKNSPIPPEQNKAEQVSVYYMYRADNGELVEIPGSDPEKFPKDATQSVVGNTVRIPFKSIDGYTPDSYQINKGDIIQNTNVPDVTLTAKPQFVTLIYTKNSVTPPEQNKAEQVTVYYKYRADNGELVEIPGSDPENFPKDATQSVVGNTVHIPFKSIDSYTPDSYQINNGNIIKSTNVPDVTLTAKPQSVTLIYTKNSTTPITPPSSNGSGNNTPGNNTPNTSVPNNTNSSSGNNGSVNNPSSSNSQGSNSQGSNTGNSNNNSSSASNGQNNGNNLPNNEPNNIPSPANRKPKTVRPHKTINKGFNIKDQNAIHNQQLANSLKNNVSSSNAQNSASNTLPQTGNDKHSSLAMLALGSLALATALGAAWFGRKKD